MDVVATTSGSAGPAPAVPSTDRWPNPATVGTAWPFPASAHDAKQITDRLDRIIELLEAK